MKPSFGFALFLVFSGSFGTVSAEAQSFELVEPNGVVTARVEVKPGRLILVDANTGRTVFGREARYDSPNGRLIGYFQFELNRVLRFPRNGVGFMQTADLDDLAPRFQTTRRTVRPLTNGRPNLPVAPGLGAGFPNNGFPNIHFGSAGFGNTGLGGNGFGLPGIGFPGGMGPVSPFFPPQPQSVVIDTQTIPNPPLAPVTVRLANGGPRDVQVTLVDLENPSRNQSMRIPPGRSSDVSLKRDAGGTQIQTYQVITPTGESATRERTHSIPPAPRYEVVVHQWQIQSVAIDRTAGAGANPIEDINYRGKPIGRFKLPPGAELTAGVIDVDRAARAQGNGFTVAPILASEDEDPRALSPLEKAIREAQAR